MSRRMSRGGRLAVGNHSSGAGSTVTTDLPTTCSEADYPRERIGRFS